ncbi:MAG: SH3 domain-containing protein [Firmicutes bacterium]|nr:SH3 domain-containing protein [Bacillota bacterium]
MSKSSVIILIIAAVVFTGLGFVVGQVVAEGNNPGSKDDPVVSQTYVDELVGVRVTDLQNQIDELTARLDGNAPAPSNNTNNNSGTNTNTNTTAKTVTVTADSVNIRQSATTDSGIVATVSSGTVLTYIDQTSADGYTWYNIRTSGGSTGWIRSDLCSSPK